MLPQISINFNLFDGFGNKASYQAARLQKLAIIETQNYVRSRIQFEAVSLFLQVCIQEELMRIEAENLLAQRQQLVCIENFWSEGIRTHADVLQQKAFVAEAELQVFKTERDMNVALLRLKRVLNLNPAEELRVVSPEMESVMSAIGEFPETVALPADSARADIATQQQWVAASEVCIYEAKSC